MNSAHSKGALFAFLSFTVFAFGDAFIKLTGLMGAGALLILCGICWGTVFSMVAYAGIKKELHTLNPKKWKPHLILSCLLMAQGYAGITSFTNLPITTVYIAMFTSPFIISSIGALFLKERLSRLQIIAILIGFCGVVISLLPEFSTTVHQEKTNPLLGYIALPFFVGFYVAAMLYLRVAGRTETPASITLLPSLIRGIILIPFLFALPQVSIPWEGYLYMAIVGITATFGFVFMTKAYQLAPTSIVSPFHYSQLIVGAIMGYVIWQTVPHYWVFIGGVIITVSGLMLAREAHRMGKEETESELCQH